jgi:hypothetical protein
MSKSKGKALCTPATGTAIRQRAVAPDSAIAARAPGPLAGPAEAPGAADGGSSAGDDQGPAGGRSDARGRRGTQTERPAESASPVRRERPLGGDQPVAELRARASQDGSGDEGDDEAALDSIEPTNDGSCPLCGSARGTWKTCGIRAQTGKCGRPDPRRLPAPTTEGDDHVVAQLKRMAPDDPMRPVWAGQLWIRRCGARCRTTGVPCRSLPVRDGLRCRMHGGRSTGPKPKHGRDTLEAQRERRLVTVCRQVLRAFHPIPEPIEIHVAPAPEPTVEERSRRTRRGA